MLEVTGPRRKRTGCPELVSGYGVSAETCEAAEKWYRNLHKAKAATEDVIAGVTQPDSLSRSTSRTIRLVLSNDGGDHPPIIEHKEQGPPPPPLSPIFPTKTRTCNDGAESSGWAIPIPLTLIDHHTIAEGWFDDLARLFLSEVEVHVKVAVHKKHLDLCHPRTRNGRCTVSGLTALFLAMRVREESEAVLRLLGMGADVIAADIRRACLGDFVGASTTRLAVRGLVRRIVERRAYTIAYDELRAARDMLVTCLQRDRRGRRREGITLSPNAKPMLLDMIHLDDDSYGNKQGADIVELLALRMGLLYAALMGHVVTRITALRRRHQRLKLGIEALATIARTAARSGAALAPYGIANAAVNDLSAELRTIVVDSVSDRLKAREWELREALEGVCDKFNVEVLRAAESGYIAGLEYPELVPRDKGVGVEDPEVVVAYQQRSAGRYQASGKPVDKELRRPTVSEVARFTTNVLMLLARQDSIRLINNVVTSGWLDPAPDSHSEIVQSLSASGSPRPSFQLVPVPHTDPVYAEATRQNAWYLQRDANAQ